MDSPGTFLNRTELGSDLEALIDRLGAPVISALPVTGLPAPGARRATFRFVSR
jgi:hypothetical protein